MSSFTSAPVNDAPCSSPAASNSSFLVPWRSLNPASPCFFFEALLSLFAMSLYGLAARNVLLVPDPSCCGNYLHAFSNLRPRNMMRERRALQHVSFDFLIFGVGKSGLSIYL